MAEWQYFPLWGARPEGMRTFSKKERDDLELIIAEQVAGLLARHGKIDEVEVNMSTCPDIDEPSTYQIIEVERVPLEDSGDLIIGQVPETANGFITAPGAHSLAKEDENGCHVLALTVWDPSIEKEPRITDARGKKVSRLVLQELFEALAIVVGQMDAADAGNEPPLSPAHFPIPVVDPEFQALALQFEV